MNDLTVRSQPILDLPHSAEIVIDGGVGAANARDFKDKIDAAIGRRTSYLILHMANVSYVSSSGFGYLLDLAMMVERRGGAVVLVETQPKVKVVLSNLGLANYFRFEHSAEVARAFLRAQAERVFRSPRLVALDGDEKGMVFPVMATSIRFGGDPKSTIPVKHPQVEARHCEVYRTGDQCFVRDLGSRFGTLLGDRKINDEALKAGDVLKVGDLRMAFYPPGAKLG
ncbi:MAG TPA: anti-sigma factor antagonist [Planctomycetota bacterium]